MDWKRPHYLCTNVIDPAPSLRCAKSLWLSQEKHLVATPCKLQMIKAGVIMFYTNWRLGWLEVLVSSVQQRNKLQV